jgi:DNA-directed RNA polymerase specialized sigma24 family protein
VDPKQVPKSIELNELSLLACAAFPPREARDTKRVPQDETAAQSVVVNSNGVPITSLLTNSVAVTTEDRDTLILKLMGPLRGMAWNAAKNHDHAQELCSYVLLKCELGCYNPLKGQFAAWARTVMTRRLITLLGSNGRATGGEERHTERPDYRAPEGQGDDGPDPRTTPFPDDDFARIRKWHPVKRVLLLARALLWRKLPDKVWADTLVAAKVSQNFPFDELDEMTVAERNAALAKAFRVERNTIHVRWKRWAGHLQALTFVQNLTRRA